MIKYIKTNKFFFICLTIIFVSSFLASFIQSGFGKVSIELKQLKTDDGQTLVYDLYKPKLSNSENKVPLVIVVPGFQRSKEALSNIAIELSRRGIAIALIDPYAQGMSSSSTSRIAATTQGYGMFALVDYAYQGNFPFVDVDKIGSTGHSMGGNAAIRGADYFGKEAIRNEQASKLHSVYVSGYFFPQIAGYGGEFSPLEQAVSGGNGVLHHHGGSEYLSDIWLAACPDPRFGCLSAGPGGPRADQDRCYYDDFCAAIAGLSYPVLCDVAQGKCLCKVLKKLQSKKKLN